MWPALLALAVVLAVAIYLGLRKDFAIYVAGGEVQYRGKIPFTRRDELEDFLLKDLDRRGPVVISGKQSQGRLRLWFKGVPPGEQQRIRNFLLTL
jgi:hypothetical protein